MSLPPDSEPFLAPGTNAAPTPGVVDWVRSPACPNNVEDCRITVTMTAASTPIPTTPSNGYGEPQPPLVAKALPRGKCSVCNLSWDITNGPKNPVDYPLTPYPIPPRPV